MAQLASDIQQPLDGAEVDKKVKGKLVLVKKQWLQLLRQRDADASDIGNRASMSLIDPDATFNVHSLGNID